MKGEIELRQDVKKLIDQEKLTTTRRSRKTRIGSQDFKIGLVRMGGCRQVFKVG